jgi:serine/threonine protein kinase
MKEIYENASSSSRDRYKQMFLGEINREFDVLKSIDHPNIVKLIDVLRVDMTYYFIQEFFEGR